MEIRDVDVLIVGGGLVGCSLALALAGSGCRLLLVDAPGRPLPLAEDPRKLALAATSLDALAALGVLDRLAVPPAPIRRIHASRAGDFGHCRIEAAELGRDRLGGVLAAGELGRALLAAVRDLPGSVLCIGRAEPLAVDAQARTLAVHPADGGGALRLRARLVVAADGSESPLRRAAGIAAREQDYHQTLFVSRLQLDHPSDGSAWERLTADGPCALLPMSGGWYGGLCAVASADAEAVRALDEAGYCDWFQQRFGWRAGRVRGSGPRSAWPLRSVLAERLLAERLVLVGNAAQTLHPIGAQGFNLGLRDALSLAEVLEQGRERGIDDPGDQRLLADYAEARREDRERTVAFSDGLARISAGETPIHRLGRSLGLLALGLDGGLRARFAAAAMGYRGRLPRLLRELP